MTEVLPDLLFVAIVVSVAAVVQQGGMVKSGVRAFALLAAGLFAMNGFEPLAAWVVRLTGGATVAIRYGLFGSLIGLFAAAALVLNLVIGRLLPEPADASAWLDLPGRCIGGALAGLIAAVFLFAAVHTYPGPRDFWGCLPPEPAKRRGPILSAAPEDYWLRLTRHVSRNVLNRPDGRTFEGDVPPDETGPAFVARYADWRAGLESR